MKKNCEEKIQEKEGEDLDWTRVITLEEYEECQSESEKSGEFECIEDENKSTEEKPLLANCP